MDKLSEIGGLMKTIAAILLLPCCAFGQDKAAVSATEAGCGPRDVGFASVCYWHYVPIELEQ
jgi:hypothetical protein